MFTFIVLVCVVTILATLLAFLIAAAGIWIADRLS